MMTVEPPPKFGLRVRLAVGYPLGGERIPEVADE